MIANEIDSEYFLLKKKVDWSLLNDGMTIPVAFQSLIHGQKGGPVSFGENRAIKILIEGEEYAAVLNSVNFDRNKYSTHKDLLQIRYSPKSTIARKLQDVYSDSFQYLKNEKARPENYKKQIKIPEYRNEYIALFATPFPDVYAIECFTAKEDTVVSKELSLVAETEYELSTWFQKDNSASLLYKPAMMKMRRLDRSIGNSLKKLYDYKCQVSGEKIGDKYGDSVVEVHHIEYFTTSLNNDSSNIIVISPNFHRIIHKNNPRFNREKLAFEFDNGVVEPIKLDKHLRG